MKEITLDIPSGIDPDLIKEMHGCLLRFFEPKEEPKFKRGDILRVPENIKLYQPKKNDDQIYIGFGDRQLLGVFNGVWHVMIDYKDMPCEPIQCELILCKREDLKAGDTAFVVGKHEGASAHLSIHFIESYFKIINSDLYAYVSNKYGVEVYNDNHLFDWYKVVPIKE